MDEKIDEAKGRVKEAAGDLTDDQSLKDEGKVDRTAGGFKAKIDKVADKVKDTLNRDDDDGEERS